MEHFESNYVMDSKLKASNKMDMQSFPEQLFSEVYEKRYSFKCHYRSAVIRHIFGNSAKIHYLVVLFK